MPMIAAPPTLLATKADTVRGRSALQARGIIDDVTQGINSGALQPGDRLPDERSLCQRYVVARHTVRKAMEALEKAGLVGRFVGRGSFVLAPVPPARHALLGARNWTLFELTEARLLLEPGVAMLAAERRTDGDLTQLLDGLVAIGAAENWRQFKEAKYDFHRGLAQISGNDFVCDIFDQIVASRRRAWDGYQPRQQDLPDARSACLQECRAIFEAVEAGMAERAAETVRASVTRLLVSLGGS